MIKVLALMLMAVAIADWGAAAVLVRAARKPPPIRFLTAVATASVIGALGATVLVPLCLDALQVVDLGAGASVPLLAGALLLFGVPGPAFLIAHLLGYFHEEETS